MSRGNQSRADTLLPCETRHRARRALAQFILHVAFAFSFLTTTASHSSSRRKKAVNLEKELDLFLTSTRESGNKKSLSRLKQGRVK